MTDDFGFVGSLGRLVGVLLLAAAIALGWRLGWREARGEVFAALVQTILASVVVAGLLKRNRSAANQRQATEQLIQRIERMGTVARHAKLLLAAHRSAKTWSEQLRSMIAFDEELASILAHTATLYPSADRAPLTGAVRSAVNQLKEVRGTLHALIEEYRNKHAEAGWKQERYEQQKEAAASWPERSQLHQAHWEDLKRLLPQAKAFATHADLAASPDIRTLEGRLLQAATLLWSQFRPLDPNALAPRPGP